MRSFAVSTIGILIIVLFMAISSIAQTKCTCLPTPPGGSTQCPKGQTAVCGVDMETRSCVGQCMSDTENDGNQSSYVYAARLLSQVLNEKITDFDVVKNQKIFNPILDKLNQAGRSKEPVNIEYKEKKLRVCINLTFKGLLNLDQVVKEIKMSQGPLNILERNDTTLVRPVRIDERVINQQKVIDKP